MCVPQGRIDMGHLLEVDEHGSLTVPSEVLGSVRPHSRYRAEVHGELLVLRPERGQPFWLRATPEERVAAFRAWDARHREGPGLSGEALRRENLYE